MQACQARNLWRVGGSYEATFLGVFAPPQSFEHLGDSPKKAGPSEIKKLAPFFGFPCEKSRFGVPNSRFRSGFKDHKEKPQGEIFPCIPIFVVKPRNLLLWKIYESNDSVVCLVGPGYPDRCQGCWEAWGETAVIFAAFFPLKMVKDLGRCVWLTTFNSWSRQKSRLKSEWYDWNRMQVLNRSYMDIPTPSKPAALNGSV